jgi:hypothetical protein
MKFRPLPFTLTRKQWIGVGFIYLSGIGYAIELIIPFLSFPHKGIVFTTVLIIAESSFLIGLAFLGKAAYKQGKAALLRYIKSSKPGATPQDSTRSHRGS